MPHSSGGGSSGGGVHSGSSHTSNNSTVGSNHYFPGARRYVYYIGGSPRYYYSSYDLSSKKAKSALILSKVLSLVFVLVFIAIFLFATKDSLLPPTKIKNTEQYQIEIKDNANVIGNTTSLEEAMIEFKDITGITPAIYTVNRSDIPSRYADLESYAYDEYIRNFDDETHWLIVYASSSDWDFEGMQGNETDTVLSSVKADRFNDNLYKYLTRDYSLQEALTLSFNDLTPVVMESNFDILLVLPFMVFVVIAIVIIISFFTDNKKIKNCQEVKGDASGPVKMGKCHNCGKTYVETVTGRCPHCGADVSSNGDKK